VTEPFGGTTGFAQRRGDAAKARSSGSLSRGCQLPPFVIPDLIRDPASFARSSYGDSCAPKFRCYHPGNAGQSRGSFRGLRSWHCNFRVTVIPAVIPVIPWDQPADRTSDSLSEENPAGGRAPIAAASPIGTSPAIVLPCRQVGRKATDEPPASHQKTLQVGGSTPTYGRGGSGRSRLTLPLVRGRVGLMGRAVYSGNDPSSSANDWIANREGSAVPLGGS
jgi:hypothetical protein